MEKDKFLSSQTIFRILVFLVLLNLLFLDSVIFENRKTEVIERTVSIPVTPNSCPASCIAEINKATSLVQSDTSISPAPSKIPPTPTPTKAQSLVKEFFVPFGTGSNSSDDWIDVPGARASIDIANYGNIKTVTFEASVRIPTGNETAYVRLYNVTDKHPVWFSDVSLDGGTGQLLTSKPVTLDSGNKTYQVQMKTSLKYPAFLDQSRLHIITY